MKWGEVGEESEQFRLSLEGVEFGMGRKSRSGRASECPLETICQEDNGISFSLRKGSSFLWV